MVGRNLETFLEYLISRDGALVCTRDRAARTARLRMSIFDSGSGQRLWETRTFDDRYLWRTQFADQFLESLWQMTEALELRAEQVRARQAIQQGALSVATLSHVPRVPAPGAENPDADESEWDAMMTELGSLIPDRPQARPIGEYSPLPREPRRPVLLPGQLTLFSTGS